MLKVVILLTGVVLVSAIMNGVLYKRLYNKSSVAIEKEKRRFALNNRQVFGVSNHGSSLDDINEIYSLLPEEIGLRCGDK